MTKNIRTERLRKGEIIPPIYDFMFTAIFNKPENIIILENFLSNYLNIPLEDIKGRVSILSRNLDLEHKHAANKQVDLLLELENKKINIEVSTHLSRGIINRNVVFACNAHATSYKHGDRDYSNIGDTIQINFVYDKSHPVGEKLKETYYLRNESGNLLTENIRIDYVNIARLEEKCYTGDTDGIESFCRMLITHSEEEFKKIIGGMRMEKEAKEKLIEEVLKYSNDKEVVAIYSDYTKEELERNTLIHDATEEAIQKGLEQGFEKGIEQGLEQGIEQGLEQGIQQGKIEQNIEIAKNLLKENVDTTIIIKVTHLTEKEIEKLKENIEI